MRKWLSTAMLVAAGAAVGFSLAAIRTPSQAQASRISRASDGHPNLSGIWQAMNNAHWDLEDHAARLP